MKGVISGIITAIMLANIAYGYTVTVTINGIQDKSTSEAGNTVQIIPKEEVEYWEVESGGITITNNQFIMPENDVSIIGITPETTHTITSTAEGNGTISPEGETEVTRGESQTYTITPNSGYEINEVTVDGISKGAISIYTFNNVTANHTITATFKAKTTATIVSQAGEGGGITPEGPQEITIGESQTYTITANSGNIIYDVIVDGESQGGITEYTFSNVTSNHIIRAEFTESDYLTRSRTLTINPNGGTWEGSTSTQNFTGTYEQTKTISAASKTTARTVEFNSNGGESKTTALVANGFKTWQKEGGGTLIYESSTTATFTYGIANTTLTAIYNEETITLPTASKAGHSLNGWYTEASGGTKIGNPGESYTPTENITLYAQWTSEATVEITLHSNTTNATTTQIEIGVNGQLPQNTYKNEGYAFTGWNTKTDGTGKSYEDMGTYNETTGATLYAQWTAAIPYQLTVNSNIGITNSGNQNQGEKVTLKATHVDEYLTPTWNSEEVELEKSKGTETSFIMPGEDVTVTLTYNQKYTLTAILDGEAEETYKIGEGEEVTLIGKPRPGESIIAWEGKGINIPIEPSNQITFIMPANNVTIRAVPGQYTLKTEIETAGIYTEGYQTAGSEVTVTAERIEGKSFVGWTASGINIGEEIKETTTFTMPYNDVTLIGKYETYTLTTSTDGYNDTTINQTAGETITLTATPRGGEVFAYWETEGITIENNTSSTISFQMPYNNTEVRAVYGKYLLKTEIEGAYTSNYQADGENITITASEASGKTFTGWEATGITLTSEQETSQTITITMPPNDVVLKAVYE